MPRVRTCSFVVFALAIANVANCTYYAHDVPFVDSPGEPILSGPADPDPQQRDPRIEQWHRDLEAKKAQMYKNVFFESEHLESLHEKIDTDFDRHLSMLEIMDFAHAMHRLDAQKHARELIAKSDQDKDGKIAFEEFHNMKQTRFDETTESFARWKAFELERFEIADHDRDGILDAEELPYILNPGYDEKIANLTAAHTLKHKDADKSGELSSAEFFIGVHEDDELFQEIDSDTSQGLSLQELEAYMSGRSHAENAMKILFERVDMDSDSMLTVDELKLLMDYTDTEAYHAFKHWSKRVEL